jgi:hypothetical protein
MKEEGSALPQLFQIASHKPSVEHPLSDEHLTVNKYQFKIQWSSSNIHEEEKNLLLMLATEPQSSGPVTSPKEWPVYQYPGQVSQWLM